MRGLIALFLLVTPKIGWVQSPSLTERAILYNDGIVERQVEAGRLMNLFGRELQKNQVRHAEQILMEIQSTLQRHLKALETLPPFEGETALRDAARELFQLYFSVVNHEYPAILAEYRAAELTGRLQIERVRKLLEDIRFREAKADAAFLARQKEFAAKYGFPLRQNKLLNEFLLEDSPTGP
ncbi:MAG: hypothetical protein N2110_06070 [Flavobacteriales bacterium]|nr:hypothetical protein [Flavobacteriales bacterium]MCX7768571.1 hypothetical protein [Flavobacteriales bacterium]MDW8409460.1 hypothetical protein [Flavobacteriales bacterium]